jgi:hypothetical protein
MMVNNGKTPDLQIQGLLIYILQGDVSASPLFLSFDKHFILFDDKVEGIAELQRL